MRTLREKFEHSVRARLDGLTPAEHLGRYKAFLKVESHRLKLMHRAGAGGREVCHARAQLVDVLIGHLWKTAKDGLSLQAQREFPSLALVALGWALELYKYDPFRTQSVRMAQLVVPKGVAHDEVVALANTSFMVRDLINTPANLFGTAEIEGVARKIAKQNGAKIKVISGAELAKGFPLIQAVGGASPRSPRLIDFTWGKASAPKRSLSADAPMHPHSGEDWPA